MNEVIRMLSGGSLISDERANEAADRALAGQRLEAKGGREVETGEMWGTMRVWS